MGVPTAAAADAAMLAQTQQHARFFCQVIEAKLVASRQGRPGSQPTRIAECLVGDDSGVMVLTARNEQGEGILRRSTGVVRWIVLPSGPLWMPAALLN